MSKLETNQIDPATGTTLTLGTSGDTVTVPTGVGLTATDEVKSNKLSPATGTALQIGDSGDTITVPSGATIVNSGTATGFGQDMTPAFCASNANTGFSAGAFSKIAFATEVLDTDGCYDNSSNYRFTPTTAGYYYVSVRVAFNNDSASSREIALIYKNGSSIARGDNQLTGSYWANNNTSKQCDYVVQMNGSSDYLEAYGYTEQNGETKNTLGYGVFLAYRITGA